MKSILRSLFFLLSFSTLSYKSVSQGGFGLDLTWPMSNSVTQRSVVGNSADITIAGQLLSASASTLPSTLTYKIYYSASGGGSGALVTSGTVNIGVGGVFHKVIPLNKGWYILNMEGLLPGNTMVSPLWSSKFGIGDIFVVAGQSNAKGAGYNGWDVPPTSTVPEWIVSINQGMECLAGYPTSSVFSFSKIEGANRIAPTGENSWCYAVLGKLISDANGGMPVAFFNTAYGGSGIRNWYESRNGSATNDFYSGTQYCTGQTPSPIGQPYKTLKNALNYYASLFGVRAVLWHQGEAETANPVPKGIKDSPTYQSYLNAIIAQTRSDFTSSLSWIIARASYNTGSVTGPVITAQGSVAGGANNFLGPNTDTRQAAYRDPGDNVHFRESASSGLSELAALWKAQIDASGSTAFARIPRGNVPTINVTKSGSNRTLTAPSGAAEYRWGLDINTAVSTGTVNSKTYVSPSTMSVQCFVRWGNNWTVSAKISMGSSCTTCRENQEISTIIDEVEPLVNFRVYPNPAINDLNIEFNVLKDDIVKLELIDINGKILRTFANGPHAAGTFKYPISLGREDKSATYFCRITIGQTAYTKRLVLGVSDRSE
jgi:hypothetical protein